MHITVINSKCNYQPRQYFINGIAVASKLFLIGLGKFQSDVLDFLTFEDYPDSAQHVLNNYIYQYIENYKHQKTTLKQSFKSTSIYGRRLSRSKQFLHTFPSSSDDSAIKAQRAIKLCEYFQNNYVSCTRIFQLIRLIIHCNGVSGVWQILTHIDTQSATVRQYTVWQMLWHFFGKEWFAVQKTAICRLM